VGQWTKSLQLWFSSAVLLMFVLLAPANVALGQGNSDFGQSHKPSDPGNSDFGQSHDVPTPEPATLTLLALGAGAAVLGARFRKGRRK